MKTFSTELFCFNCGRLTEYEFPYGSTIQRGAYGSGTMVRIPKDEAPGWESEKVICNKCGSDRVG